MKIGEIIKPQSATQLRAMQIALQAHQHLTHTWKLPVTYKEVYSVTFELVAAMTHVHYTEVVDFFTMTMETDPEIEAHARRHARKI